jgi:hypothetical protein
MELPDVFGNGGLVEIGSHTESRLKELNAIRNGRDGWLEAELATPQQLPVAGASLRLRRQPH